MLDLYRLSHRKRARELTGEGGLQIDGRWHHAGIRCIYAQGSAAQCLVESPIADIINKAPHNYVITWYKVPDSVLFQHESGLKDYYFDNPVSFDSQDLGTALLREMKALVIAFPSAVMQNEWTYIINPEHPLMAQVQIVKVYPPFRSSAKQYNDQFPGYNH